MNFILPFTLPAYPFQLNYKDRVLLIGSCFSEEIGDRLKVNKWKVLQNPNGILYDPVSIAEALNSYISLPEMGEEDLVEINGLWHSWKYHSSFSALHKEEVVNKIHQSKNEAHDFLKSAQLLIITLGTAYNYQLKETGKEVSNCHKASASLFNKNLLEIDVIQFKLSATIKALQQLNPELKILFTISPVKHIKDGIIQNNRSKARLLEAAHALTEQHEKVYYFPSYELATDILRDYRFYKNDLVHPNDLAIDYIFEKFCEHLMDAPSQEIQQQIQKIISAKNHRAFFEKSISHQNFITTQLEKIDTLEKAFPFLDFTEEKKHFSNFENH